jgi:transposase-like protein
MPRARVVAGEGQRPDWRSQIVPRYARRPERVDEAIRGVDLSGTNTRRIRGALAPRLRGGSRSKAAGSRRVGRRREDCASWSKRDRADEQIGYLVRDGGVSAGADRKDARAGAARDLGGRAPGGSLRTAGEEREASWKAVVDSQVARNVGRPSLAVIDGNPGLERAPRTVWSRIDIQRCTNHKLWNLLSKAPVGLREELAEDYRRMIYTADRAAVEKARVAFVRKWKLRCKAVSTSFEEAGDDLFTFLRYPASQWKSLRTTNALERINEEFRRRTKPPASRPSEDAVLLLLFGLLRTGPVVLRRIVGWQAMPPVVRTKADEESEAA